MSQMNHDRLTAVQRIRNSKQREMEAVDNTPQEIGFGKHADLRPAELILKDPRSFYWNLSHNRYHGQLGVQAWEISQKASCIMPPRARPSAWCFWLKYADNGRFLDFGLMRASEIGGHPDLATTRNLNLAIIANPNNTAKSSAKLSERFHEEFFPGKDMKRWDYQLFFDNGCRV